VPYAVETETGVLRSMPKKLSVNAFQLPTYYYSMIY